MVSRELLQEILQSSREDISKAGIKEREISIEDNHASEAVLAKGVRRCGKTFLTYEIAKKYDCPYINFEDERLIGFSAPDFAKLLEAAGGIFPATKIFIFDEVQNAQAWEKFVARLYGKCKFYITGSSSYFTKHISPLTGRHVEKDVLPLSFREYLSFHSHGELQWKTSEMRDELFGHFSRYSQNGGLPKVALSNSTDLLKEYFRDIVSRDLIKHSKVDRVDALERMAYYLLGNAGAKTSYRSLAESCGLRHELTA
ncbi:ATP-binding protein, partial [Candidatus Micrarchaeota archaeon]|nr:ATP-binding protein [Candidatus Micrarchaeota archaeon]